MLLVQPLEVLKSDPALFGSLSTLQAVHADVWRGSQVDEAIRDQSWGGLDHRVKPVDTERF